MTTVGHVFPFGRLAPASLGNAQDVAERTRVLGTNPIVVADSALLDAGLLDEILGALATDGVVAVAPGEPTVQSVEDATETLAAAADVVVAVGGGSTLDTAKLAAALVRSDQPLTEHLLGRVRFAASLPVVAVPTTAGSGAEVTRTAVVSAGARKSWVWDDALLPSVAVLDSDLTLDLPEDITASTGLDAFVHALEAATAQRRHEEAEAAARWAFGEIRQVLPAVLATPDDPDGRRRMLVASCVAGAGIDRCGTGVGHALGHAVGSLVKVPHGLAVMLGTLVTVEWSAAGAPGRFDRLASDVPTAVRDLAQHVGFEQWLAPVATGQPLDVDELATELAREEHRPMRANNAVPATEPELFWLAAAVAREWNRIGFLA